MQALLAVYKREVTLYFKSFIGYGIAVALMLFVGFYQVILFDFIVGSQASYGPSGYAAADLASQLVGVFVFLLFLISPLLTMSSADAGSALSRPTGLSAVIMRLSWRPKTPSGPG